MSEFFARVKATLAEVYEVEKELGEGGMAIVFLATDRKHGRKVAIKVMRPELAEYGGIRVLKALASSVAGGSASQSFSVIRGRGIRVPKL
jgi:serine/threonine protein kinase